MASASQDPEVLRRFIEHHVAALRDYQKIGDASQAHHDRMLTWSIGLMGAGVFAAYGHLPTHSRGALAPWILGILFAILARLVGQVVQDKDRSLQFVKIQELLALLLLPTETPGLAKSALAVLRNEGDLRTRAGEIVGLNQYSNALSWAAYILLAACVVAIFWALA